MTRAEEIYTNFSYESYPYLFSNIRCLADKAEAMYTNFSYEIYPYSFSKIRCLDQS